MTDSVGIPPFEFLSLVGKFPTKRIFVRDPQQAWYHRGVLGQATSIRAFAHLLADEVRRSKAQRVVVAGASAGGYAALIFGTLIGADLAIAFSPQTVLDLTALAQLRDHRWDEQIIQLAQAGALDDDWIDLRQALPPVRRSGTSYHVYFDALFESDRLHAERLSGLEGLRLFPLCGGGHNVVYNLRNSGELEQIIAEAVGRRA